MVWAKLAFYLGAHARGRRWARVGVADDLWRSSLWSSSSRSGSPVASSPTSCCRTTRSSGSRVAGRPPAPSPRRTPSGRRSAGDPISTRHPALRTRIRYNSPWSTTLEVLNSRLQELSRPALNLGAMEDRSVVLDLSPFPSPTLLFSVSRWDLFLAFALGWQCYSCPVDFLSRWWECLWCLGWLNYRWI